MIPKTIDDVVTTMEICRAHDAPVLSRGGGTSLAGQCCNVAVMIDHSKYLRGIVDVDADTRLARVQPGVVLDQLRNRTQQQYGLTFGPDPSTHDHCTFGGMIGNNSCGVRSIMAQFYGPGPRTSDNVHELEVLLYDGRRLRLREGTSGDEEIDRRLLALRDRYADLIRERYPNIPRRVSGYNLDDLLPEKGFHVARALVGTESTCVTVLEATVHLIDNPPARSLLVLGYEDKYRAADDVMRVLEHRPNGLEGVDHRLVEDMKVVGVHDEDLTMLPEGRGWLLVEFGGDTKQEADDRARECMDALGDGDGAPTGMKLYDDPQQEEHVWKVREAGLGATAFIPGRPDTYEGWEDSAVPPERLGEYLRRLDKLAKRYEYESATYGHYGNGCVHARWNFDFRTREGIATFRRFLDEASDLVLELGGSISGEHGDGQSKAELLPKMFGPELIDAFREFKSIWDPQWKMNPGKVVDPNPITSNLRLGTDYRPPQVETHFAFPDDHGSFAHATTRCVGIGKCRRTDPGGDVMCPSYQVTLEEKHTTRGRARILWEMLNGGELDLWRSREVYEALDLCLSCKGCTHDCPVSVDMPTLKAEFLSHHYKRRLRPRAAYAFGLIDKTARLAVEAAGARERVHAHAGREAARRRACRAGVPGGRAANVARLVPLAAGTSLDRQEGHPLGRHLQQPLPPGGRRRRGRGARDGGVPRHDSACASLLRPSALRLRDARPRAALPRACARHAARRDPRGHADRRDRAELHRGSEGRSAEADAERRGREAPLQAVVPPRGVPLPRGLRAAAARGARARARPLSREGDVGLRAAAAAAREDGPRRRELERRLLRHGRSVGLREGALRRLDRVRRARALPGGATRRRRRARGHRRLLVQDADRAGHGTARAPPRRGAAARARSHGRGAAADGVDARSPAPALSSPAPPPSSAAS